MVRKDFGNFQAIYCTFSESTVILEDFRRKMDTHWRAAFTVKLMNMLAKDLFAMGRTNMSLMADEAAKVIALQDDRIKELEAEIMNIGSPYDD